MRDKEIEEAIKSLNINKTMVLKGGDSCIASVDNIETVLAYIEETEKERDGIYADYQDLGKEVYFNFISKDKIKDKIKELENMRDTSITSEAFNIFNGEIIVLKEILEK